MILSLKEPPRLDLQLKPQDRLAEGPSIPSLQGDALTTRMEIDVTFFAPENLKYLIFQPKKLYFYKEMSFELGYPYARFTFLVRRKGTKTNN